MPTWTERIKEFQADVEAEPDNANSVYNLAMATAMSVESGEAPPAGTPAGREILASAEKMLNRVLEATGGRHGNARAVLARICMITGRADAALEHYSTLMRDLNPRDGAAWANSAQNAMAILMTRKSYEEAQALGARWCAALPEDAEAFNRLGLAWGVPGTEGGDRAACEKAREAFGRAVAMGHPQAGAFLARVQQVLDRPAAAQSLPALTTNFQREVAAVMSGPLAPAEKMQRVQELQQRFQADVKRLTEAPRRVNSP